MIIELFNSLGFWAWIILGLLLLLMEILVPGTFFLWFGVSAILVGIADFAFALGWQEKLILFGVLSLISVVVWRIMASRMQTLASDAPLLNERAKALVGREFTLQEPIVDGAGRVKVNDSYWRVQGPDCDAGQKVKVVGGEGVELIVEAVSAD